jgi:hypothetical protein|uniref:Uncharacterized protein n=1 Tax=viral metagenome TaxID=1070528 RepID=A0A6C0L9T8_9ZZZZ
MIKIDRIIIDIRKIYARYTMDLRDIDTTDMEIYNTIIVEKVYKTAFLAFWILFSQLL